MWQLCGPHATAIERARVRTMRWAHTCPGEAARRDRRERSEEMNLNTLEMLARSATPGIWEVGGNTYSDWINAPSDCIIAVDAETGLYRKPSENDFAFMAAANPDTVLALLRVVRAAKRNHDLVTLENWTALHNALKEIE